MRKEEYKKFTQFMAGLGELFDKEITKTLLEIYWHALEPYSLEEVKRAVNKAILTCKFFPKPAEIIELIEGPSDSRAEVAWAVVIQAIKKHGGYQSIIFDDPAITAAIKTGSWDGWVGLCEKETDELNYIRSEFKKLYNHFHAIKDSLSIEVLPGIAELDCLRRGLKDAVDPPYLVRTGCYLTPEQEKALIALCKQRKALTGVSLPGTFQEDKCPALTRNATPALIADKEANNESIESSKEK